MRFGMTLGMNAALVGLALAAGQANAQSLKLLGSASDSDFDVPTSSVVTRSASFAGIGEPVTGIGLSARYTTVSGDFGGGAGPWPLDVEMTGITPDSTSGSTFTPIGGDVTIADFPLANGARTFPGGVAGNGSWDFEFGSTESVSNWTYGLRDVQYHLFGDAPSVTYSDTVTPDASQQWDRPFFIGGVSALGPVAFDVLEFTVDVSGVYEFESVLSSGSDHFTFLYDGAFDASQSLENLVNYGLGNGNDPFGSPRGTSSFDHLLMAGETYYFVTSQWASFSTLAASANSIVGPGSVTVIPAPASVAMLAASSLLVTRRRR